MAASLAKRLRATVEVADDEREDLAGYTQPQVQALVAAAFSEPHPSPDPIRFTFIIGGGKLVRSKYSEELGKWLCAALRELGYEDDRGAALGAQRAYKTQHDLGQNLIYLHVFPARVPPPAPAGAAAAGAGASDVAGERGTAAGVGAAGAVPETPLARCLSASLADFAGLLKGRVAAWSHRRQLLAQLQAALRRLDATEAKMVARQRLEPAEQAEYEAADRPALEEKVALLTAESKAQVAAGGLTVAERATVLEEMAAKLDALRDEAAAAAAGGAASTAGTSKRAAAATAAADALAARRAEVQAAFARTPPASFPVRGLVEIRRARAALAALDRLEKANEGRMLSPAELHAAARELDTRPALQRRLAELVADARGWFEADAEWEARLKAQSDAAGPLRAGRAGR